MELLSEIRTYIHNNEIYKKVLIQMLIINFDKDIYSHIREDNIKMLLMILEISMLLCISKIDINSRKEKYNILQYINIINPPDSSNSDLFLKNLEEATEDSIISILMQEYNKYKDIVKVLSYIDNIKSTPIFNENGLIWFKMLIKHYYQSNKCITIDNILLTSLFQNNIKCSFIAEKEYHFYTILFNPEDNKYYTINSMKNIEESGQYIVDICNKLDIYANTEKIHKNITENYHSLIF